MFCSLSGAVPLNPVFSPKTQLIYEKSLIIKSLDINSRCPVTNIELDKEKDIVEVKSASDLKSNGSEKQTTIVPPRTTKNTSFPDLLQNLTDEWDTAMLEVFELRKQLQITREELVRTLYERDAACRVIARLTKGDSVLNTTISDNIEQPDASEEK